MEMKAPTLSERGQRILDLDSLQLGAMYALP